ncbi:MAG: M20/M25/M40 family metallo-hydrolase [Comamonadaceae bacterium]|nr:M20/M25/M40 family metallo-hydrolase [Comamonadaceae bacterium]
MTGSHFDTVRDGGSFDGRLGILAPIVVAGHLHERGERLPFHLDVVAFAEEEGLRFRTSFLASSALVGQFDYARLEQPDADGVTLREAMCAAGLPGTEEAIAACAVDPRRLLGYIEVHIEQGPVLLERGLPLGRRHLDRRQRSPARHRHRGRQPCRHHADADAPRRARRRRRDGARRRAALRRSARCRARAGRHGRHGRACRRARPTSCRGAASSRSTCAPPTTRRATPRWPTSRPSSPASPGGAASSWRCRRRCGCRCAPCSPQLMDRLAAAIDAAGLPVLRLASGAGHDAMVMARVTDVCMLFVRCGNGGISHNPLETMTADDAELAARVLLDFLRRTAREAAVAARPARPMQLWRGRHVSRGEERAGPVLPSARRCRHCAQMSLSPVFFSPPTCLPLVSRRLRPHAIDPRRGVCARRRPVGPRGRARRQSRKGTSRSPPACAGRATRCTTMLLRLTIDTQPEHRRRAGAESDWVPYPGQCDAFGDGLPPAGRAEPASAAFAGAVQRAARRHARLHPPDRTGGRAADRGDPGLRRRGLPAARQAHEPSSRHDAEDRRPFQLDRCRALRVDGPAVAKFYPRWYTRAATHSPIQPEELGEP